MPAETPTMKPRRSSSDVDVDALVAAADRAQLRHSTSGKSWSSIKRALAWYFLAREKMSSPEGLHPRSQRTASGEEVVVRVDGGPGGDMDDTLATIVSIGQALGQLKTWDSHMHHAVVRRHRDGIGLERLGTEMKVSTTKVSRFVHEGEMFLVGFLRGSGVLR